MNYEKYEQLIKYITVIDPENINDKNKSYRLENSYLDSRLCQPISWQSATK